jgi:hypothetical protein
MSLSVCLSVISPESPLCSKQRLTQLHCSLKDPLLIFILAEEIKSLTTGLPGLGVYGIGFEKSVGRYSTFFLKSD